MRAFSAAEAEYLESKRLGRLATVGRDGSPQVVPVGFRLNCEFKTIDGRGAGPRGRGLRCGWAPEIIRIWRENVRVWGLE